MFILPRKVLKLLVLALYVPALTFAQVAPVIESSPIKIAMAAAMRLQSGQQTANEVYAFDVKPRWPLDLI